jgi:predicted membrane channel-forming protein YqfA (hemolysin III family)
MSNEFRVVRLFFFVFVCLSSVSSVHQMIFKLDPLYLYSLVEWIFIFIYLLASTVPPRCTLVR